MKKERVLFLVHVEDSFRRFFPDSMYVRRLQRAMGVYDRIIALVSEVMDDHAIWELEETGYYLEEWRWSWGYEKGMFYDDSDDNWVIETSSPHQYTWVPPELRHARDWERYDISVGGGCREECLQDFLDVLEHVGIPYRLVDGYVY